MLMDNGKPSGIQNIPSPLANSLETSNMVTYYKAFSVLY